MTDSAPSSDLVRPAAAGVVSALVGFTSAFAVVLAGLSSMGATPRQAASGLLAVTLTMGLSNVLLATWTRMPITIAWSTPGAALLASTAAPAGGWPVAVGAFVVTAALITLTGLVPWLGALIARIPAPIAQAMLGGVLFQLCLGPITGLAANPWQVAPVVLTWLLASRWQPRWAAPLAFVAAALVIGLHVADSDAGVGAASLAPQVAWTTPEFTLAAAIGVALPLYLVTMAAQNVPGVAVMRSFGYAVPWRRSMIVTGVGTAAGAPLGGHAINLAAISAALAAGPEAGEDRSRRWIASVVSGVVLVGLAIASSALGTLVQLAPEGVIPAVAGVALLGTFAASLRAALADEASQLPAILTFITAASGVAIAGVSPAFWALLVGLVSRSVLSRTASRGRVVHNRLGTSGGQLPQQCGQPIRFGAQPGVSLCTKKSLEEVSPNPLWHSGIGRRNLLRDPLGESGTTRRRRSTRRVRSPREPGDVALGTGENERSIGIVTRPVTRRALGTHTSEGPSPLSHRRPFS